MNRYGTRSELVRRLLACLGFGVVLALMIGKQQGSQQDYGYWFRQAVFSQDARATMRDLIINGSSHHFHVNRSGSQACRTERATARDQRPRICRLPHGLGPGHLHAPRWRTRACAARRHAQPARA